MYKIVRIYMYRYIYIGYNMNILIISVCPVYIERGGLMTWDLETYRITLDWLYKYLLIGWKQSFISHTGP